MQIFLSLLLLFAPFFSVNPSITPTQQTADEYPTQLMLYYSPTCPYCRKVLGYLDQIGATVPMKDVSADPAARQELIAIGGKKQVPCLVIDGKALYESADIIAWLKKHPEALSEK